MIEMERAGPSAADRPQPEEVEGVRGLVEEIAHELPQLGAVSDVAESVALRHAAPERVQIAAAGCAFTASSGDTFDRRGPDFVHGLQAAEDLGASGEDLGPGQDTAQEHIAVSRETYAQGHGIVPLRRAVAQRSHQVRRDRLAIDYEAT